MITVAHTGIAATLLLNGTTVHRRFAIPVGTDSEQTCQVEPDSELEKKIREAEIVIWDEAGMSDKRVCIFLLYNSYTLLQILACVEKLLSSLDSTDDRPFGGKMMILGGDWKQLLPIVKMTYGPDIVNYTIKRSPFWHLFKVSINYSSLSYKPLKTLHLKKNMRLEAGAQSFAKYLERIGSKHQSVHGFLITLSLNLNFISDGCKAILPDELCAATEDEVINWAYGDGALNPDDATAIKNTSILTVLNKVSLEINNKVKNIFYPSITLFFHSRSWKCWKERNS